MSAISGQGYAILIASSQYPDEPKLDDLRCPENDVDGLNEIFTSDVHGVFTETFVLKNKPHYEVMKKILKVLRQARKEDLVLIYYSGHGKLNLAGNLHLATFNTVLDALEATSIPVQNIHDFIDISASTKVALILDCCFSGAVGRVIARGSVDDQLQKVAQGRGKYIITASTGVQVALEKESDQYGMLTKHIIEGIQRGEADYDEDGLISIDELYRYVHDHVLEESSQEPMKWDLNVRGELYIARTGKTPREEKRRKIRIMLHKLAGRGVLPDAVLRKAIEVTALEQAQPIAGSEHYEDLLDRLFQKRLQVGEFIGKWYKVELRPSPRKRTTISGSIKDADDSTPISEAKVVLRVGDKELAVLFSDSQGRFKHEEAASYNGRTLTCQVEKEEYQGKTLHHKIEDDEVAIDIELIPAEVEQIEFRLNVKDERGNPLEGVDISLKVEDKQAGAGLSDKDGLFRITLSPGLGGKTLDYTAKLQGYRSVKDKARLNKVTSRQITMTEKSKFGLRVGEFLKEPYLKEKTTISGSVKDAGNSAPIPNAKVVLRVGDKELTVLFSDSQGRFKHEDIASYNGRTLTCKVEKEAYQGKTVSHKIEDDEAAIDIELIPTEGEQIEFKLSVKDERDNPLEGVTITLKVDGNQVGVGLSDKDGLFRITLSPDLEGKMLHYNPELKDYESVRGEVHLKEATHCDVSMKKIAAVSGAKESQVTYHRGGEVLVIGIIGLVCFPLLGIICGLIAWVMADYNLKQMDAGMMDPSGRGLTKAGKICGIAAIITQILSFYIFVYYPEWF